MIEDFRDANPAEFSAFYELGQFITGDVEAVAKMFLKQGYDGEHIAAIAFDIGHPDMDDEECFGRALLDTGLPRLPSKKESLWLAVRYYLNKIIEFPDTAIQTLSKIINLDNGFRAVELFNRPDCDECFAEQKKKYKYAASEFAGQAWGIEKLYGIYYSSDDWTYKKTLFGPSYDDWRKSKLELQRLEAVEESKKVLINFFSLASDLPESLNNVGEFL